MSQIASLAIVLAPPLWPAVTGALSLPAASAPARLPLPATAATTAQTQAQPLAEAAPASIPATAATTANRAPATATAPGESTVFASADAGAAVATAAMTAAMTATDTTAAPANASVAFNTPATTTQPGTPSAFPTGPSPAAGVGGAVTALVVVIALILALAWLAKRMPVLGGGTGSNPALRIVGSLALGPRERVVVVAVGDIQLLLGVGAAGTRTLHTLAEPLPVANTATPAFAQLLAQHFGKKA